MKLKSKLFVILIMLCMLFAVAGVSASDNSSDIVAAEDNYKLNNDLNHDLNTVDSANSDDVN